MPNLYELLIRGNPDGTISGSHVVYFDSLGRVGAPVQVATEDWPEIAQAVNSALFAKIAALQAQLESRPELDSPDNTSSESATL